MTNDLVLHPQIFCAHNKRKFQSNNNNQTNGSDRFQYRVIELDPQWSYHSQISVFIHYIMCIAARLGKIRVCRLVSRSSYTCTMFYL